jgi:hypothetical protein
MAEPVRARLTGFTTAMSRHGAKAVPHDADTLRNLAALNANGITGASITSRISGGDFAVVDGVKVYKQCERDAMDYAIRRKPIPQHMVYEYGVPYADPGLSKAAEAPAVNAEIDALLASVAPGTSPEVDKALDAAATPAPVAAPGIGAEVLRELAAARKAAADLGERVKALTAELAASKATAPNLAENTVSVEIAGFGTIDLVVDYLWQQGNVLVIGTLKSKRRAQAIPKPTAENTNVRFAATIQNKHYELVAFGDLRFPIGDLDVQAFIITNTIGGAP